MLQNPLVSVLMTAFNRERFIAEAIESVLASTYQNLELIVVDDGSIDRTIEIANSYQDKDNRIKVFLNKKNLGDYPNRNKAASYAKGKYLKYLDSDDIIYPHGLEVMVNAMEKFPDAGAGLIFEAYKDIEQLPLLLSSSESFNYHFFKDGLFYMGPSACIYNREYFNQLDGFTDFGVASDYEFNLRIGMFKPIVLMPRDLIWWRKHENKNII